MMLPGHPVIGAIERGSAWEKTDNSNSTNLIVRCLTKLTDYECFKLQAVPPTKTGQSQHAQDGYEGCIKLRSRDMSERAEGAIKTCKSAN